MINYLTRHIKEEIEGAIDYMTKALELKSSHPDMAAKFYRMSEMEIEHASCLTKMFNSTEKPDDMAIEDYSAAQKSIINDYTTSMSKVEAMKKLYWTK